jgi:hydrogenase maturation protease
VNNKEPNKNILILCAGYPYGRDAGFGSHLARALTAVGLPEHVECLEIGESISEAPNLIDGRDKIIIIDVLETADEPGTVYRIQPEQIMDMLGGTVDPAKYHLLQTLYEYQVTGDCPEAVFVGIVPRDTKTLSQELTPEIAAKIPAVVKIIIEEISPKE